MKYGISRRNFLKLNLAGSIGLSVMSFRSLVSRPTLIGNPGGKLEDLISINKMKWVYAGPSNNGYTRILDANDDAMIAVDPDVNNTTVRQLTDPQTSQSYAGTPINVVLHDAASSIQNWEFLAYSENLDPLTPMLFDDIVAAQPPPAEMGGEVYDFLYRGLDTTGGASGTTRNLNEQIDRYQTFVTIDYVADGTPGQFTFTAPHDVVKYLMEWGDPLPFDPNGWTINPAQNEFVPFFTHLQELIQSPQNPNGLEDDLSRLINRMTPSPNPGPNPAYTDLALLDGISQSDVLIHDNLYPTHVRVDQQDLTTAAGKLAAQEMQARYAKFKGQKFVKNNGSRRYKPTGAMDISYTPPMPDATLPTSMQGLNNQNHLGWMHTYTVQCDPGQRPELSFSGMSSNLQPSWRSEETGNPDEYMVHVLLQTGDQQSLDNLAINMVQTPVGIDDGRDNPQLPTTPLVVYSNFPEPFNPRTTVRYDMKNPGPLDISIYNILGQKVENLYNGQHQAGKGFEMNWDSKGKSTGVYFMRFETPGYVKSERMILEK